MKFTWKYSRLSIFWSQKLIFTGQKICLACWVKFWILPFTASVIVLSICGLILVIFLVCLPPKSFLCKCHHPKSHHVHICCHYVLQTSGGSPYPGINGYEIARKLKQGYRMPKPQHVDYNLWVSVTHDVTIVTTVIPFNPDEWMKWLYV